MFDPVYPVDVVLLRARYIAAFEHYLARAAKLAEQSESGRPQLVQQLEEERKALEDFAAVRSALMVALAMSAPQTGPSLVAETRDEVIRRSIAKRDQGSLDTLVRKRRLSRPQRIA
jgi:hypothetical protein